MSSTVSLINVGYRSTNYYVLGQGRTRLLIDLGWPGSLGELTGQLKRKGLTLREITHAFATHYHPDHAGLAQELKLMGPRLIVIDEQVPAIDALNRLAKPGDGFEAITLDDAAIITTAASRAFLAIIGLTGHILATPGHSPDSMSLVLDSGEAFTGDLTPEAMAYGESEDSVRASWAALRQAGARTIYPGHGPARPVPAT